MSYICSYLTIKSNYFIMAVFYLFLNSLKVLNLYYCQLHTYTPIFVFLLFIFFIQIHRGKVVFIKMFTYAHILYHILISATVEV